MICDEARPLCGIHALELLDAGPRAALERHLHQCPACSAAAQAMRRVAGAFGYAAPATRMSPDLKARLLIRLDRPPAPVALPASVHPSLPARVPPPVPSRRLSVRRTWGLAGLIVMALAGVLWDHRDAARRQDALQARLTDATALQERALAGLRRQSRLAAESPLADVRLVTLAGGHLRPLAKARLAWNLREQSWRIQADNLAPLPIGQHGVLWAVCGTKPVNLGVVEPVSAAGTAVATVFLPRLPSKPVAAMLTLEPSPLAGKPSGDVLLMGLLP